MHPVIKELDQGESVAEKRLVFEIQITALTSGHLFFFISSVIAAFSSHIIVTGLTCQKNVHSSSS